MFASDHTWTSDPVLFILVILVLIIVAVMLLRR